MHKSTTLWKPRKVPINALLKILCIVSTRNESNWVYDLSFVGSLVANSLLICVVLCAIQVWLRMECLRMSVTRTTSAKCWSMPVLQCLHSMTFRFTGWHLCGCSFSWWICCRRIPQCRGIRRGKSTANARLWLFHVWFDRICAYFSLPFWSSRILFLYLTNILTYKAKTVGGKRKEKHNTHCR